MKEMRRRFPLWWERSGEKFEKKKEKPKETIFRNSNKNTERPIRTRNSKGNREGNRQENLELKEVTDYEGEVLGKLAETFNAGLSNTLRIKMLDYCKTERSFSEIMRTFRLNPASLKHHQDLLQESGLVKKTGKGKDTRYKTTDLGKTMLNFADDVLKVVRVT